MEETWYSGRLLFERVFDDTAKANAEAFFEEKLVVFRCEETGYIVDKLTALAKKQEEDFDNDEGNRVRWLFREILEVQEILAYEIGDGTEVWYRHWHDPGAHDLENIRRTHEEPWWRNSSEQPGDSVT